MDFLEDTSLAIARMRKKYDEMDEKKIYERAMDKGIQQGAVKGKILLLKDLLSQKIKIAEKDAKYLDGLKEEEVNQLANALYKINTPEDFHKELNRLQSREKPQDEKEQLTLTEG